jgi:hydroxyethylthiazole kinase-like uncharacterized protein yjeF
MIKVVTVDEMRTIEAQAAQLGVSYEQMMDKAGQGVARYVLTRFNNENQTVLGLIGSGNNGGDTLVALATMAKSGWKTFAYLVKSRAEGDPLTKWYLQCGGELESSETDIHRKKLDEWLKASSVLLDGVLGTGATLPLSDEIASLLRYVNSHRKLPTVIAVDCPSGVNCDTGEVAAECIPAHTTICMAAIKSGLLRFPAFPLAGRLEIVDIALPKKMESWGKIKSEIPTSEDVRKVLPTRPLDAHKGTFGTAMIAAGSINYIGAAYLCAAGAYATGTGLVQCAVPEGIQMALAGRIPEATWLLLPSEMGVISEEASGLFLSKLQKATAVLLGPGWGTEETTKKFLANILEQPQAGKKPKNIGFIPTEENGKLEQKRGLPPLVIDADGLRLLVKEKGWGKILPRDTILTPHPGEMSNLCGLNVEEIQKNRLSTAREFAEKWGCIVVLKGALTVVGNPNGQTCTIPLASSALAKAGSGDVLAGMITGLRALGMPAYEAAWAGAWLHAQAGLIAARYIGSTAPVTASTLLKMIPKVFKCMEY